MPTVRRLTRQVSTQNVRQPRRLVGAPYTDSDAAVQRARGRQFAAVADLGADVAGIAANVIRARRQRADQLRMVAFQGGMLDWEFRTLHDPDTGLLTTTKGEAVLELDSQVDSKFDEFVSEALVDLPGRLQGQARLMVERRRLQIRNATSSYAVKEMNRFTAAELDATKNNAIGVAIANADKPEAVSELLATVQETARAIAEHRGFPQGTEAAKQIEQDATSALVAGVSKRLINQGNIDAADAYFETGKDNGLLTAEAIIEIESNLKAGKLKTQAQEAVDTIMAETESLDAALSRARTDYEGDLEDEVTSRIRTRYTEQQAADRMAYEETLRNAYNLLDETHDVDSIAWTTWDSFDGSDKANLRRYAEDRAGGAPAETDWATYHDLFTTLTTPSKREEALKLNLLSYRSRLGDTEFKQLVERQAVLRNPSGADGNVRTAEIDLDLFNSIAADAGLPAFKKSKTTTELERLGRLESAVESEIARRQDKEERELHRDEKEAIMKNLIDETVLLDTNWFRADPRVSASSVGAEERDIAYVPIEEIPALNINQFIGTVREMLPERTSSLSDAAIRRRFGDRFERAYAGELFRLDESEIEAILRGE